MQLHFTKSTILKPIIMYAQGIQQFEHVNIIYLHGSSEKKKQGSQHYSKFRLRVRKFTAVCASPPGQTPWSLPGVS